MPSYAAFIGHQPHISVSELGAAVPGFTLTAVVDHGVALFKASDELPKGFLSRLGGTMILAGELADKAELAAIPEMLRKRVEPMKKGKVTFAIRAMNLTPREIRDLYKKCKDVLKKAERSSRYVGNEHKPAATILLHDAGMLNGKEGCEICVVRRKEDKGIWVGVTLDAQNPDAYTKRDMEKPVRDTTVGLLPPKLAQVMLNFGVWLAGGDEERELPPDPKKGKKKEKRAFLVFDPFCGTGVVPMEVLLRGYGVLASDKSDKAVQGTEKNLEWLRKQEKILKTVVPSTVWKQDATKPFMLDVKPDVIVTETSLGPNLRKRPLAKEAQSLRSENDHLQEAFLKNVAATLPGVPLVCTWPVWYCSKGPVRLERIWTLLAKLGYEAVLPKGVVTSLETPSLLYRRPEQFVGRELVLLKPKR
jgi:tRNA G10  N-methylase Trm11